MQILFWLSFSFVFYSYVLFPFYLSWKAKSKKQNETIYALQDEQLPEVSILLAVYNEEKVIEQKILSTFNTTYPLTKIKFFIGSDSSTDATDSLIKKYQTQHKELHLSVFPQRTGKASIVNQLQESAAAEILILTDANVFFEPSTIYELVKHYKNPEIALVGGNIINEQVHRTGISQQEKSYLNRENLIKYQEGILWGTMIGAFGGCYSIRKTSFSPVPPKFFMDDFYITLSVLESGKKAINELNAHCHEDVSNKISEEFRRKIRISIGNFQNLFRFKKLLFSGMLGLSFCFWSHKVLRWLGPFFILSALLSACILKQASWIYAAAYYLQMALILLPFVDYFLKSLKIHLSFLRFISHFYLMNLALLFGFFRFMIGVKSNVWKPTERFQQ